MITPDLVRKHLDRLLEAKATIKSHTRISKKGKVAQVDTHDREVAAAKKLAGLKKTVGAGSDKDNAYINALLTPVKTGNAESDLYKNQARGGNIDRVLERVAAGQMFLSDEVIQKLKKARSAIKD